MLMNYCCVFGELTTQRKRKKKKKKKVCSDFPGVKETRAKAGGGWKHSEEKCFGERSECPFEKSPTSVQLVLC